MRPYRPYSDGVIFDNRRQERAIERAQQPFVDQQILLRRPRTENYPNMIRQYRQMNNIQGVQSINKLVPVAILMALCCIIYFVASNRSCSAHMKIDVDEVERNCYEEYSDFGCLSNSTSTYSGKKYCQKLKKCLEDPESFAEEEERKNSVWNNLIENIEEIVYFFKDRSIGAIIVLIFITLCRFF